MLCLVVQTLNIAIEKIAFGKRDEKCLGLEHAVKSERIPKCVSGLFL